jgi:hypothetical protein
MCHLADVSRAGFYRYLKEVRKRKKKSSYDLLCKILSLSIVGGTAIGESPQSCERKE